MYPCRVLLHRTCNCESVAIRPVCHEKATPMSVYTLPDLPYDYARLEPHISGQILELHHDKHHAAYVKGANDTLEQLAEARDKGRLRRASSGSRRPSRSTSPATSCTRSSGRTCRPDGGGEPEGELADGDRRALRLLRRASTAQLTEATTTVQGSGWGVLSWEPLGAAHRGAGLRPPGQRGQAPCRCSSSTRGSTRTTCSTRTCGPTS